MDCQQAQNLLCARLDREITPEERGALELHLQTCPLCRGTADALPLLDADLRRAFAPRRAAADAVAQQVIARLALPVAPPTRRMPPWMPMLLSAAAGFLLAVGIFRPWQPASVQVPIPPAAVRETVRLTVATGPVEVLDPDASAWRKVDAGESVAYGCRVKTPPDVRCEFRTEDQAEVRLNGNTEVTARDRRKWNLTSGQILANVADAEEPFEVRLADATISAQGKLQRFDVSRTDNGTLLTVLEGSARVKTDTADDLVQTGEALHLAVGQIADKRQRAARQLIESTRWVHEILMLKGPDNRELGKRIDFLLEDVGEQKGRVFNEDQIRAMGDACVLPLTRYLQSPRCMNPGDETLRDQASRIVADLAQPRSIPDLISLLDHQDGEVRAQAARGLQRLTRETQGSPPESWRVNPPDERRKNRQRWEEWWARSKARFAMVK
jgi:hypothetical protein